MSMVVRTNSMAMNANSALNKNNSTVAGNLQKLSTGFRINRAADDASGLAVSEKMKAQIKALDQANKNAQDGASLIKTAEGYMGEIHDMLNRIVELAEKSANGTFETKANENYGKDATTGENLAATDRQAIQDEVDQLTTEIDRIASTANFNQLKLLDGSMDSSNEGTTTRAYQDSDFANYALNADGTGEVTAATYTGQTLYDKTQANEATYSALNATELAAITKTGENDTYADNDVKNYYVDDNGTIKQATAALANAQDAVLLKKDPTTYKEATAAPTATGEETTTGAGKALKLQIGETSDAADKLEVSIMSFKTAELFGDADMASVIHTNDSDAAKTAGFAGTGADAYQGLTINVSNQDTASAAAEKVRTVINKVSAQRATLGAMENRLDYTMNNLDTASQNITDANSRIRDTDMAKTMMEYTQGNTLTQAAQAMLAQANQAPSQVLQLLQ